MMDLTTGLVLAVVVLTIGSGLLALANVNLRRKERRLSAQLSVCRTEVAGERAERNRLESGNPLRQEQKMEAIGTLAGGIAHDFNNLLTPILGYAEMAHDRCRPEAPEKTYLEEIIKASLRAQDLANQILTFSRRTEPDGKPICVTPIAEEVVRLQRASLPRNIEVRLIVRTEKDVVVANPTQIDQILMNLCTNGAYAMRERGGILEIVMTDFLLGPRTTSEFPNLEAGRYLRLSVRDTGTGIEPEVVERIFDPFFTTRKRGAGTGLGLAVVHGIVSALKGTIDVDTAPGKGSVFHVILPVLERTHESIAEHQGSAPAGTESILFVDDEEEIARKAL